MIARYSSCQEHEKRTVTKICETTRNDCSDQIRDNTKRLYELRIILYLTRRKWILGKRFVTANVRSCNNCGATCKVARKAAEMNECETNIQMLCNDVNPNQGTQNACQQSIGCTSGKPIFHGKTGIAARLQTVREILQQSYQEQYQVAQ